MTGIKSRLAKLERTASAQKGVRVVWADSPEEARAAEVKYPGALIVHWKWPQEPDAGGAE